MSYLMETHAPTKAQQRAKVMLARKFREAYEPGKSRMSERVKVPPGRPVGSQLTRRRIEKERAPNLMSKAEPWQRYTVDRNPHGTTEIMTFADASASMRGAQRLLGVLRYLISNAGQQIHAHTGAIVFGKGVYPAQYPGPRSAPRNIEVWSPSDPWESPASAWALSEETMPMMGGDGARLAVFLSDFRFSQQPESAGLQYAMFKARQDGIITLAVVPKDAHRQHATRHNIEYVLAAEAFRDDLALASKIGDTVVAAVRRNN